MFQVIQVAVVLCYDADYSSHSYYINDVHPQSDQKISLRPASESSTKTTHQENMQKESVGVW